MAIAIIVAGFCLGVLLTGEELLERYRIHGQISQIAVFDEAVANFHEKYEGLPGDLLAITASRAGLPAGDGTPGHGDGDGNISPCNVGWEWHLGCETALFWAHLAVSGMVADNFSADSRLENRRLAKVGSMDPYLPVSPLYPDVYLAVWNSDPNLPAPMPHLPQDNYYQLSRILGVVDEKMVDDSRAITPLQARAIDEKMDDGRPLTGRVIVNGEADWHKDAWGSYAKPGMHNCIFTDKTYNTSYFFRAKARICHIAIHLECCKK